MLASRCRSGRCDPRWRGWSGRPKRRSPTGSRRPRRRPPLNAIGAAVDRTLRRNGHSVCKELAGHGIGRRIHESPDVPSFYDPRLSQPLTEGLVLTIEPIIATGTGAIRAADDGWAFRTSDGTLSANAEHILVITEGAPLILTAD
jgi:methionyl aminopeptidase